MCGLAGVFNLDGRPADEAVVRRMSGVLRHRGLDDDAVMVAGPLALAHRRLAIIDLSAAGRQPMTSDDGCLRVVYNGEIYNYRELAAELRGRGHVFRSRSDTEVILHAYDEWGTACVERFNGMFAIVLWDARRRRLWLARDRLGVKPLYYAFDGRRFAFASEIKALRECPGAGRTANPRAIAQYLRHGYALDDESWFAGVRRLMPGCEATVSAGAGLQLHQYWDPIERYRHPEPADDYPARIRELLRDSVRLRVRSDVPVGAHLSGGIDSGSVVALMSEARAAPVCTFSGAFREGGAYDERPLIRQMVAHAGADHHEVEPDARQFAEIMPRLVWAMDEPQAGPGLFPQAVVCAMTAAHGVKVVLGGQGGDELFGGYPRYLRRYAAGLLASGVATRAASGIGVAPALIRQAWAAERRRAVAGRFVLGRVGGAYHSAFTAALAGYTPDLPRVLDEPIANQMYNDLRLYLPALLHVEDRASMAVSIESRHPFLDYRLVELAAAIPPAQKFGRGELKHPLRQAMRGLLPEAVVEQRHKRGFATPISPWFRGPLAGWVEGVLMNPDSHSRRVFSPRYLATLLSLHRRGVVDAGHHLWTALNVALWFEQFDVEAAW